MFAGLMIANGVNHLASPLYLGQFLPGQYTSPLLILASIWLILAGRRVGHPATPAGPILGSFLFFIAAPGTVAGWIPYAITGWRTESPIFGFAPIRAIGTTLIVVASVALVECFARFAIVGRGVPAPVAPTTTLVVSGLYRHCRNPMYVAVVSAILGQALVFGSASLFLYAAMIWLAFHLFVLAYEEPTLTRQFTNYTDYRQHVPRWIPRLRPWAGWMLEFSRHAPTRLMSETSRRNLSARPWTMRSMARPRRSDVVKSEGRKRTPSGNSGLNTVISTWYALTRLRMPGPGSMNPGRTQPACSNDIARSAPSTRCRT
jgi:protein-S-isoprenylcysteine O-methyltransferase Ste14